jgi:hypothetical protein
MIFSAAGSASRAGNASPASVRAATRASVDRSRLRSAPRASSLRQLMLRVMCSLRGGAVNAPFWRHVHICFLKTVFAKTGSGQTHGKSSGTKSVVLFFCRERPKLLLDNVTGEPTMLYNGVQFGSGSTQLVFTIGAEQILFGGPKFELLKPLNISRQARDKHT